MEIFLEAYHYFLQNQPFFWKAVGDHLVLSFSALGISLLVAFPIGLWIAKQRNISQVVINIFNAMRVVPSLAILFLALPYLGLGFVPSLIALTVLAFPPVLISTYTGIRGVNPSVIESASGMGMTKAQVLTQIEIPLAIPAIISGIRIASVEVISSATLASFIGGGGLGDFITRGFALYDVPIMLVGAIPVALFAMLSEIFWSSILKRYPVQ
ncbi:MAG TPA: glycine/betaine ABC transporter [Anaerolineaceae bacterium]|jgi:osmoprotectant transport system permease protein|nr:glycine/betaine ABC transporter [Anaerolineaceae bacterium]